MCEVVQYVAECLVGETSDVQLGGDTGLTSIHRRAQVFVLVKEHLSVSPE